MKKLLPGLFGIILLLASGCSDSNVDLVKDGFLLKYTNTTIGKAFEANFDNCKWRTEESKLGTTYVIFTGRINERLHSLVADKFTQRAEYETRSNIINIRDFIRRFPKMLAYSFNVPDWEKILTEATGEYDSKLSTIKEGAERARDDLKAQVRRDIDAGGSYGKEHLHASVNIDKGEANQKVALQREYSEYFPQQLEMMIDKYVCPVGAEVSFKWQIDMDGTTFEFNEFKGDGIPVGTSLEAFLKFIYTE